MSLHEVLSEKQLAALRWFEGDEPKTNPYAAGTISSLAKLGLVEKVLADDAWAKGKKVTKYQLTDAGREALGLQKRKP